MSIGNYELIELINHALEHDPEATELLYEEFYGEVYFICLNILSNKEDAEDITQDTFIEAFTNLDSLKQPLSFKNWLSRIAANKAINFLKKMNRISLKDQEKLDAMGGSDEFESSFENKVIEADVYQTLIEMIQKLPQEQRMVVFLFYYQEMSVREIAELCGCSENTIKSRLRYARLFLKKEIEKLEDKGYQLRCIAVLPFMFALFREYRDTVNVSAPCAIIPALSSKSSGSAAETEANQVTKETAKSNSKRKVIKLSKGAKIGIAGVAAAVVVSGGVLAAVMAGCGNSDPVKTETSESTTAAVSSEISVSESSVEESVESSESEESTESIEESSDEEVSEESTSKINWTFRSVKEPSFKDSEYKKVKPYSEVPEMEIVTATPSYTIDMDAAGKKIKENDQLSADLTFGKTKKDTRSCEEFNNVGIQTKYNYEEILIGFPKDAEEIPTDSSESDISVSLESILHTGGYNAPDLYELKLNNTTLSQDQIYDVVKDVFGEELAEYLVYSDFSKDESSDGGSTARDYCSKQITTPNGNTSYTLYRSLEDKSYNEGLDVSFQISISDSTITADSNNRNRYEYYANGYVPIEPSLKLSDMLECDLGGTDLKKMDNLFSKALDFGGSYDKYQSTDFVGTDDTGISISETKYDDGSVYYDYDIQGNRRSSGGSVLEFGGYIDIQFKALQSPDGKLDIKEFSFSVPNVETRDSDKNTMEKDMKAIMEQCKTQAKYLFGLTDADFKNAEESSDESSMVILVKDVKLKVFGIETKAAVVLNVYWLTSGYRTEVKLVADTSGT